MWTKRILLLLPIVVSAFLLQSYLWVPTYEEQARATPDRLSQFITASIGDAQILNPILNADTASSGICDQVFDGLIDRDKDLNWRGRLATHWEVSEEAYFLVNTEDKRTASEVVGLILEGKKKHKGKDTPLAKSLENISSVEIEPAKTSTLKREVTLPSIYRDLKGALSQLQRKAPKRVYGALKAAVDNALEDIEEPTRTLEVVVTVRQPERIKLILAEVDQDLFKSLAKVLGDEYFTSFRPGGHVEVAPAYLTREGIRRTEEKLRGLLRRALGPVLSDEFLTSLDFAGPLQGLLDDFEKNKAAYATRYGKELLVLKAHHPIITFHLRKGVLFHDGHEFDSGDVKFTYDSIIDHKNRSPRVPDYEPVKAVETPDKHTVRVVYKRLFSPGFGTWAMEILPEHLLNEQVMREEAKTKEIPFEEFNMRKTDFNLRPIGCGPFKFVEWQTDEYIKLVRYEEYWEGPAEYSARIMRIIPDDITQEMEFYAGAIDSFGARPNQVKRLKRDPRFQNFSGLAFGYDYIGYNMRRALFKDKRVRRALGMAIDVDKILRFVRYEQAERITGPFVKQTEFYDQSIPPLPYDPEGALKLFEQAGWKRGEDGWLRKDGKKFQFTLITNNGNDIRRDIMAVAQDSWKKIGVDVKTDMLEWSVFIGTYIDQGDFDACVLGWRMGIDPDLYQIWHSSQTDPHELNFCAFKNNQADDLIIRIRQEYDKQKQVKLCHRLHKIIYDEQPYTFISVGRWTALLDKRIVIVRRDKQGKVIGHERIKATKTGDYGYDFRRWLKHPTVPEFLPE